MSNPDTESKKRFSNEYSMGAHIVIKEIKHLNYNKEVQMKKSCIRMSLHPRSCNKSDAGASKPKA
jgi:hypothetical protein